MADTPLNAPQAGAAGPPFAADRDGGLTYWPYAKLAFGPSGTQTEVADTNGARLPVKVGDPLPAGSNVIGQVQIGIGTTGGTSKAHVVAAATANPTVVKAAAGQVYAVRVFNNAAYPIFVKLHNTAVAPTPGAGVVETIGVQAGTGYFGLITVGDAFSTGIGLSIVKGIADTDATAVALNDCVVDVFYA